MKVLITGGSGFLARELITRFKDKSQLRILARNEGKLIAIKQQYPEIEIITGDIADECICENAVYGVSELYHLAAFKHVGLAETHVHQCIASNVTGTRNLLKHFEGDLFMAISTDKAAQVVGVYGATKMLMERIIMEFESYKKDTKYRMVRYGNVLYSTGSVLCKWKELILAGKEIMITDPTATRFFWTVEQAVDLMFECIEKAEDSTPYVPAMKAMSMEKLAYAMYRKYDKSNWAIDVDHIKTIGLQPGENLHETVDGKVFSNEVEQYTIGEIVKMI